MSLVLLGALLVLALAAGALAPVALPRRLAILSIVVALATLALSFLLFIGSMAGDPPVGADGERHQNPIAFLTGTLSLIAFVTSLWHLSASARALWPTGKDPARPWRRILARALFVSRLAVIGAPFLLASAAFVRRRAAWGDDGPIVLAVMLLPLAGLALVGVLALLAWRRPLLAPKRPAEA